MASVEISDDDIRVPLRNMLGIFNLFFRYDSDVVMQLTSLETLKLGLLCIFLT